MNTTNLTVVQSDSVVVSMMKASSALAEAKTISQTKKILDVAAAAEIYARRQHLSEEAMDIALAIKVEAMRKLGEMLRAAPKATGTAGHGRPRKGGAKEEPPSSSDAPTLDELGLTKNESAFAQKLAELPEAAFQEVRDGHITAAKAIAAVESARKPAPTTPPADPAAPAASTKSAPPPEEEDDGPSAEEIAAALREDADDQKQLQLLLDADEPLAAANARLKEQAARIRLLEERVRGLTNECAAAIRQAKSWRTKFEKLERTGVAA